MVFLQWSPHVSFLCGKWHFKLGKQKCNTSKEKSTRQLDCVWIISKVSQWVRRHLLVLPNNNIWPIMSPSVYECQSHKWQKYPNLPVTGLRSRALWVVRHCRRMSCSNWCRIPTLLVRILFQEIKCGATCHLRFILWLSKKKHKPYEVMRHKLMLMTTLALLHMHLITQNLFKG